MKGNFNFSEDLEWTKNLATNKELRQDIFDTIENALDTEDLIIAKETGDITFAVLIWIGRNLQRNRKKRKKIAKKTLSKLRNKETTTMTTPPPSRKHKAQRIYASLHPINMETRPKQTSQYRNPKREEAWNTPYQTHNITTNTHVLIQHQQKSRQWRMSFIIKNMTPPQQTTGTNHVTQHP
jgi:hypothetical protein